VLRIATLAWAGFWSWFVVFDGLHDAAELGPRTYAIMLAMVAGVWIRTLFAWSRPRAGAVYMAVAAALALFVFDDAAARVALAGPPIAFAIALAWISARGDSQHRSP
jgi:hypothetical protein